MHTGADLGPASVRAAGLELSRERGLHSRHVPGFQSAPLDMSTAGKKLKQLRPLPHPWNLGGPESRIFPEPLPPVAIRSPSLPVESAQPGARRASLKNNQSAPISSRPFNGGGGGASNVVPGGPLDGSDPSSSEKGDINISEEEEKTPHDDHETTLVHTSRNHTPL